MLFHYSIFFSSLLAIASGDVTCQNDEDCSLNGICRVGTCHCDAAWFGPWCQLLNLQPTAKENGLQIPGTTTWGGSILADPEHGFVMFVAKMVNRCRLGSWQTNSEVVVATSAEPLGPYTEAGSTVAPPWAHNPQAIYVPAQNSEDHGTYCVFTLGDGVPIHGPIKDCASQHPTKAGVLDVGYEHALEEIRRLHSSDNDPCAGAPEKNRTVSFVIWHSSTGALGPWLPHVTSINDFPCAYPFPANWNPSPYLLLDGRVRIMVHSCTSPWGGEVLVEAPSWEGPYVPITSDVTTCTKCAEDPFLWKDGRGHWHVLYHKMFDPPGNNPVPSPGWVGGHSFSKNGLDWSPIERAYNTTVHYEDGMRIEMKRRERPKLIFDKDGVTPTHLSNGVISPENEGATYTLVVPLQTP
uniref:EGF-like domain-containing protein n=1 Tax=Odontella aurita TaxID=265563 RepID=A0A7S4N9D3_9STRA|mmetsp:Transcript_54217/g.162335  ORF Transcript_54217/g.162335 Transcript_54217/m.162335 type:complete len:409 (+) Transcript_54217:132-1358(+)